MIGFNKVSFGFPQKDLYNEICFSIEEGEHAVLIGSNGTGKSTLVDMICNTEEYLYDGRITKEGITRIGLISQFVKHEKEELTAYDYLAESFLALLAKADELCAGMETAEDIQSVYDEYQGCLDEIEAADAYNYDMNIRKQLAVAGLTELTDKSVSRLSGGEFKLLSIIRAMLLKPQLLIMDEPDAFLDFENLMGLTRLVNAYSGTILAITHNRLMLSQCFNKVLHLENMELQEFPGTYGEYMDAMLETKILMQEEHIKGEREIEQQQRFVEKLRAEASFIDNPTKGRQLKARVSYLERLKQRQVKNPFIEQHAYNIHFPKKAEQSEDEKENVILSVKDYSLAYDKTLLENVNFDIVKGDKLAIVGANGTGKTSLLRDIYAMLKKNEAYEGQVAFFSQIYDNNDDKLSGGEKNLKQLYDICAGKAEILLLDEPTSHLDTYAQLALEEAINEYRGTIIMVSHDFYTVAGCAKRILILEDGTVRQMSARAYRKSIYKKYLCSDIIEQERLRKEKELRINELLNDARYEEAKRVLGTS